MLLILAVAVLLPWRPFSVVVRGRIIATASLLAMVAIQVGLIRHAYTPYYDVAPLARRIGVMQAQGHTVAYLGKYHDQFQFLGRLRQPLVALPERRAGDWLRAHPKDYIVVPMGERPRLPAGVEAFIRHYRSGWLLLVKAGTLLQHRSILEGRRFDSIW